MSKQQKQVFQKLPTGVILLTAALGIPLPAAAVPWNLADTPLYLGNSIPANLLFLIDDSGSMDWDTMTRDYVNDGLFANSQPDGTSSTGDGGITNRPGCTVGGAGQTAYSGAKGYSYATQFSGNKYNGNCDIAGDFEWRFRNHDFNPLYFNPAKEYKPWSGTDKNGVAFGNISPTQAWKDPYVKNYSGGGEWIDLTTKGTATTSSGAGDRHVVLAGGMRFYTWADTNGNKKFDNADKGDTVKEYAIGSLTAAQIQPGWFGATAADPVAAVKTNFANWFSYYRARHLVAKSALGNLAGNVSNMRVGLATLHNNSGVNTGVRQIDTTPAGEANRTNLMNNLYRLDPGNATPLLNALKQVGKYLSGLPNSSFPASEKAPLPVAQGGECQQNFTLVMTDGFYNGTYTDSNPTLGNADGDKSSSFDNKLYPLAGQTTPIYHEPVAVTKTLADIAMYYYENDIVSGVANKVPINPGVDENKAQHMVTFTIAFGLSGNLKGMPEEYAAHKPSATCLAGTPCTTDWNNGVFPGWPVPSSSTKTSDNFTDKQKIDDVRHAAYNGRGEFLAAQNPDELASSLESMLASIQKRTSASAGLSFNSTTVRTTTMVFQGRYVTSDWVGNLHFLPILQDGSIGSELAQTATVLKTQAPTDRVIIAYDSNVGDAVPFRWTNVGATWQTALGSSYVLDFLRGDHSCETKSVVACGGTKSYRNRSWEMGDIINSAPAYVGTPSAGYTFNGYNGAGGFMATQANRTPMVYVGANDGMLHGFDASINSDGTKTATTGKELLAYVPGVLRNKVKNLSDPSYDHKYYVDGTPTTGDVEFGAGNWRSVLVGGLRAGGQGMFALDVTDPGTFSEANASAIHLWEFTDANDIDLGYTFSEPSLARLGDGSWAAIFGNGYNSTEADGKPGSGNAVLYVVNVQTGAIIKKLDTLTGPLQDPACAPACTLATGHPNGLSGVTVVDVDGDDKADFVYAGDLFGNMWRFDISAANPSSWSVSFGGKPLFMARSKEGTAQPITVRPAVGYHPDPKYVGYMVYFGTGKYIEASDNASTGQPTQDFYGLWDKWEKGTSAAFTAFTRANLVMQEILSETGGVRVDTDNPVDWATKQGWYLDLIVKGAASNQGERVITEPVLRGGSVLFTTLIPATAICEFGGTGWLMVLDNSNGGKLDQSPVDTNNDGKFDKNDTIVSGLKSENGIPSAPAVISGAGGTVDWVAMNFSNGSLGGTGYNEPPPPVVPPCVDCATDAPAPTPADGVRSSGLRGRLSWERLK